MDIKCNHEPKCPAVIDTLHRYVRWDIASDLAYGYAPIEGTYTPQDSTKTKE